LIFLLAAAKEDFKGINESYAWLVGLYNLIEMNFQLLFTEKNQRNPEDVLRLKLKVGFKFGNSSDPGRL
jgi:hypothetical protein